MVQQQEGTVNLFYLLDLRNAPSKNNICPKHSKSIVYQVTLFIIIIVSPKQMDVLVWVITAEVTAWWSWYAQINTFEGGPLIDSTHHSVHNQHFV